ncbi:MAG: coenzyme F420-0:L-glutamate ligase [Chloroflexi bacterium]|nr:coenzyme F420-0:L-glutamate ligase [Chloroflexota bacterium]
MLILTPLPHIPHVQAGDDLLSLVLAGLATADLRLQAGDVLVLAQKIVSKAEGRLVNLESITPSARAQAVAAEVDKDPRLVELILSESTAVSRHGKGVLVVRHRLGFVSANAGIDRSNVQQDPAQEWVLLLPEDPDQSAADLRQRLFEATGTAVGIVITDSHGRPFRQGTVGVAIGVAGIPALWDRRGETDLYGYTLRHTTVGTADEIASAASLLMGQAAEATPIVHLRGLCLPPQNGRAADLIRPAEQDLYA